MPQEEDENMVAGVMEVSAPPLWEQVYNVIQQLRRLGRVSWNPSREDLQDTVKYTPGCLQSMLDGYKRQLHGSGRSNGV